MGVLSVIGCFAQNNPTFYPTAAHVNLYFPHLADGGPVWGQWQSSLELLNPSPTMTAHVQLSLFGDQGLPLSLDFGSGSFAVHPFSIPPAGRITLRSTLASDTIVEGQAIANSDIPIQGTILFRNIAYGKPVVELSAPPTLPTSRYLSLATRDLGVALANVSGVTKSFVVTAVDSSGTAVATIVVTLPGFGHHAFNLSDPSALPNLPADFSGSIVITPQVPGDQVLAWTLNVERNLISTLPIGELEWPISHTDRIQLVFQRLLAAASSLSGINLNLQPPPKLVTPSDVAAASASVNSNQNVQINLALSELVSDSPSELAFLVAHELAHIAQTRTGMNTILLPNEATNKEADADLIAMILVLQAGFDPYGAPGAIGKLSMANGSSGLVSSNFDNLPDPTPAFSAARMNSMLGVITSACTYVTSGYCAADKAAIHPHFPGSAPL
jgi:hypothetical protein